MGEPTLNECLAKLDLLEQEWVLYGVDVSPTLENIFSRFMTNTASLQSTSNLIKYFQDLRTTTASLHNRVLELGAYSTIPEMKARMHRVMSVVSFTFVMVQSMIRTQQSIENVSEPEDMRSSFFSFSSVTGVNDEDMKPYQKLLIHISSQAQLNSYRRYGDNVYRPMTTSEGHITHSWERVCDLREFIFECCRREFFWEQWCLLTDHPSFLRNSLSHLLDMECYQFPRLKRDRSAFSMGNGIYIAETDSFLIYGSPGAGALPPGLCCAKHFEHPFPEEFVASGEWRAIPTPTLDGMLQSQALEPEVQRWLFVLMGRLLYDVGHKDNW